ncbi:MAG TPA: HD domain-containing phosphohydrolase [Terriglobales bacterium]|nr:HD domain-containing phosphohydrolase [Terriglobales bacterium]
MVSTATNSAHSPQPASLDGSPPGAEMTRRERSLNKELWLLLSLFVIALLANFVVDAQRMVLALYTLPTLFSAYKYGRRHAVMTALASTLLVVLVIYFHPPVLSPLLHRHAFVVPHEKWFDVALWSGILLVIAYAMGALYERTQSNLRELRESYRGILLILQHIAANDKYSQNHAYRVSICATKIAERMELGSEQMEDIRAAALLHDVDKLGISREILYKSANFTAADLLRFQREMARGKTALPPVGGSLRRAIPILLAYSESSEGKAASYQDAPLESRILAVADAYETLTSGSGGMPPSVAIGSIVERAGTEFDPKVVEAFVAAFRHGRAQSAGGKSQSGVTAPAR